MALEKYPSLGGKASGMVKAKQFGFKTPMSYVVTSEPESYLAAGVQLQKHFADPYFSKQRLLAVRSCGASEDGNRASFAGQYDTLLNVPIKSSEIAHALGECYRSRDKVADYASAMDIDSKPDEFVILVQIQQEFVVSGIAFMGDPVTGDLTKGRFELVEGLCDKLAGGEVNPFRTWSGTLPVVSAMSSADGHPGEYYTVGNEELMEKYDRFIARRLTHLRNLWHNPIDVEFGISRSASLVIIQVRPITGANWNGLNGDAVPGVPQTIVTGVVRRIASEGRDWVDDNETFEPGEILVTRMTSPRLVRSMMKASAIVTEIGGETCHAAIVSRELNKPAIVGCSAAMLLQTGDKVEVNTYDNTICKLDPAAEV